jgi:class 3 adenylate cyclase
MITATVLAGIAIISAVRFVQYGAEGVERHTRMQTVNVINYLHLGKTLLKVGELGDLRDRLEEARAARHLDFYILQRDGGEVVFFGNKDNYLKGINFRYTHFDEVLFIEGNAFASAKKDDLTLTVGVNLATGSFWKLYFVNYAKDSGVELGIIAALLALVLFNFMRDLFDILKSLRKGRDFAGIQARSYESGLLLRGLTAYESEVGRLEEENRAFGGQVLPSLKTEILSGRTPPYDFDCTLVRTDINGFSPRFNGPGREKFLDEVNAFFEAASHIVSRYGGYVHEFVGDEVIFYFKDEEHRDSLAAAAFAVRDIAAAATGFTLKSAIAVGKLRFGRQVNGFSLSGSVLIETVRILSLVTEKEIHSVHCSESCAKRLEPWCALKFECEAELKGVPGPVRLWNMENHLPQTTHLKSPLAAASCAYYRSDDEIAAALAWIGENSAADPAGCLALLGQFREFSVTRSGPQIKNALLALLKRLGENAIGNARVAPGGAAPARQHLATLCSVSENLLCSQWRDSEVVKALAGLPETGDDRVAASVVAATAVLGPGVSEEYGFKKAGPRLLANSLVKAGIADLSRAVVKRLNVMLKDIDPAMVASGLWVCGELAAYYRRHDPVRLSAEVEFSEILDRLAEFTSHSDLSVRAQAEKALQKSNRASGRRPA